ncbi:hypothetical protein MD535_13435 [Vibrio sp. ZSDZ65]|uniref:3-demethylubiquinone-9 3-methyltransferase n=1 Tax=Vibrio qingdaonensis TaxID=2829491 RepID=A0A9X3HXN8_9VIBR|nr:hypothetical protein [Vibrio qingdaonensis]MCW8347002.1 hypothetical protein [Vibrio qingdaonensis]
MEAAINQLKKDFYAHLKSYQEPKAANGFKTLSILTQDELAELENVWIQLAVWKQTQA